MYFLSIGYVRAIAQRSRFQDIQCALRIRSVIEAFSGLSSPSSLHSMKISSSPRNTISHTHSFLLVSGFVSVFLVARSIGQFFFPAETNDDDCTLTHNRRKLDFRFYCRDALLFDQFQHFRSEEPTQNWRQAGNRHCQRAQCTHI